MGFNIAMHNSPAMGVIEGLGYLNCKMQWPMLVFAVLLQRSISMQVQGRMILW
jgi:hypothetical protein